MSDSNPTMNRRDLLRGAAMLMGTIAAGSVLAELAPTRVWALELAHLSAQEGTTLVAFGKVLYPHQKLDDAVYALLAKDLDAKAAADPAVATQLAQGTAALDAAAGGNFAAANADAKLRAVKSLEGTPFFATVRGQCIHSLYDNEMSFAHFGYPGPSWKQGGYIRRGFNDLSWLPNPPESASPAPYIAELGTN
jgi:hypothetical protein